MTRSLGSTRRHARVHCAIYTRKSSEEGLEQEFNSLQAQREACEAFINSQRHEGWVCLRAACDADQSSCCSRRAGLTRPSSAATRFPLRRLPSAKASARPDSLVLSASAISRRISPTRFSMAAARSDRREVARAFASAARLARSADRARFCLSPIRTQTTAIR